MQAALREEVDPHPRRRRCSHGARAPVPEPAPDRLDGSSHTLDGDDALELRRADRAPCRHRDRSRRRPEDREDHPGVSIERAAAAVARRSSSSTPTSSSPAPTAGWLSSRAVPHWTSSARCLRARASSGTSFPWTAEGATFPVTRGASGMTPLLPQKTNRLQLYQSDIQRSVTSH